MKVIFSFLLLTCYLSSFSQKGIPGVDYRQCSTSERNNEILNNNPYKKQLMEEAHKKALKWTAEHYGEVKLDENGKKVVSYIIPVVWHVIHNGGQENISRAIIEDEIAELNKDFQKLNSNIVNVHPAFSSIAADCEIEFRLARLDPDGNCTEGITRTKSMLTYAMDESAKFLPGAESWNRNGRYYLNIWMGITLANGAGGYAYYPGSVGMDQDGLVLRYQQLGNTVTHEVGHWLNLAHLWGSTNDPGPGQTPDNCTTDDGVADTPNTLGQTGCSQTTQSCGSIDNVQNYMEYNFCDLMFTEGQKQRMHSALNDDTGKRQTMVSLGNLQLTGTDDPYVQNPTCKLLDADFTYDKEWICEGDVVNFEDFNTYNGVQTQWAWDFVGGTPNTSSVATPAITYNTAGVYGVTYAPGNAAGFADPMIKNNIITVSSITANYVLPFAESFENATTFNNEWFINTQNGQGWQTTTSASFTGSSSLKIYNHLNSAGDITEVITPSYDLSSITNPVLTYKWAFAQKLSGGNDQFLILYSTDCGTTWTPKSFKAGAAMATATATNSAFIPNTINDWDSAEVDLSSIASESNVRFKLYFKNNGGNNFYLDDLNIFGSTPAGLIEHNRVNNLKVYPNPMNENTTVSFFLKSNITSLNIVIRDVLGKEVTKIIANTSFSAGKYTIDIDKTNKLTSGLYFLEFNADNNVQVEKLIVE
ncbi:MAG: T9SS type A sorting domain-containing protein [Flavobacteriales bacterium]|nr:T9SS type A sorting domain-containing protein [Flavobacteriales bacterium]MCB9364417.1 T9SS type A sorting domain-containing protein [Flavobacteriales bacterium]